jgi:LysR family transcriptional regulator, glycine cleavage system transcriptional activator
MPVQPPRPRLPSLNALRAFEVAARLGHFARAAEELAVTPSAVAQQIRQLEGWLGAQLFHRQAQGVVLTPAAREALPVLAEGFDRLAQAVQRLRASLGPPVLSIAALPSIAQFWLSPRVPRLRQAFPRLQVSLAAEEQPPRFRRDLYDLGVFYLARAPASCLATVLATDTLVPVCAPGLLPRRARPESLAGQTLLHDATWRGDWAAWLRHAGAGGVNPARGPVFSLYSLAVAAALAGEGVLIGRERLVAPLLAEGRLVAPFPLRAPLRERLMLLRPRRPQPELAGRVADWLVADAARPG